MRPNRIVRSTARTQLVLFRHGKICDVGETPDACSIPEARFRQFVLVKPGLREDAGDLGAVEFVIGRKLPIPRQ